MARPRPPPLRGTRLPLGSGPPEPPRVAPPARGGKRDWVPPWADRSLMGLAQEASERASLQLRGGGAVRRALGVDGALATDGGRARPRDLRVARRRGPGYTCRRLCLKQAWWESPETSS